MFKRILIATEGTQHSSSAIIEAIDIARKLGSEIYLLHILKKVVLRDQHGISHSTVVQKIKESAKKYMDTFKGLAESDGVIKFETIVSQGKSFHEAILEEAVKINADLIMIGRRSASFIKRLFTGRVTANLLKHSTCNILIVPLSSLVQWKNIMLIHDGSDKSDAATTQALKIANIHKSKLMVLLVSSLGSETKAAEEKVKKVLDQSISENITVESLSIHRDPCNSIINLANERNADVIITGTLEEGGFKDYLKGSFTEQIIYRSTCAVLVIKS